MRTYLLFTILILAVLLTSLPVPGVAQADNLGTYTASLTSPAWIETDISRSKAPVASEYDYTYGDENAVSFDLPWMFPFYGQQYNQITADTNGNIWFTSFGPSYTFDLANTTRGPVISAWHDDLSSYASGGVFVQRKTIPEECIVIEWQTETYTEEGYDQPNNFQVVLYPNGTLLMNYKSFTTAFGNDNGSGISKGDGTDYTSIENIGAAYTLAGQSIQLTNASQPTTYTLNVNFTGTGSGTIISTPSGISCNTGCSGQFQGGELVTLHPQASPYSLFAGWSGGTCSGTTDCIVTLNADTTVTAAFDFDAGHQVKIDNGTPNYYSSIQSAYNAAADGTTLNLWATSYTETLSCNLPIFVTLQGGFDAAYSTVVGDTVLDGSLSITDGTVITDGLTIK